MIDVPFDTIKRAAGGNMPAFEEVYKASSSFVYNVALRVSRNRADAEDVTQEVFMNIYHNLKNFQFRSSFKTWVYRITVNSAINRYRKSVRDEKGKAEYKSTVEVFSSTQDPASGVIHSDNQAVITALLETLTERHRMCLILREIEGLSYEEISTALKIPINTVRSRLKRAREALLEEARRGLEKNEV